MTSTTKKKTHLSDRLWDLWCLVSVIGIWPRFIEPRIISSTKLSLPVNSFPAELNGLKVAQFSDLHLNPKVSQKFLDRLVSKINQFEPDIIVFTGDFLCNSEVKDPERLQRTLKRFKAKHGCYAIVGNHDYQLPVSINEAGYYDIQQSQASMIKQGFKRLLSPLYPVGEVSERAKKIPINTDLIRILNDTPFRILNNQTETLSINGAYLNITGLGEYMLGKCLPDTAFETYRRDAPGIILSHNPDSFPMLKKFPGDLILAGHTHGAQVNFPFVWNHFTLMEQPHYKRGLFSLENKWLYVNRGIGSVMPFRWFSTPEITLITLESKP